MKRTRRLWTLLLVPAFALVACERPTATDGLDGADGTAAARGGSGAGPAAACDVTVDDDDGETIQGAVDAASAGTTICVEPGTYAEQVSVDEAVTVQGRTARGAATRPPWTARSRSSPAPTARRFAGSASPRPRPSRAAPSRIPSASW